MWLGAHVHAVAGQRSKALELILEAEQVAEQRYSCPYEIATAYVSVGDADTAFKWFRKALKIEPTAWPGLASSPG